MLALLLAITMTGMVTDSEAQQRPRDVTYLPSPQPQDFVAATTSWAGDDAEACGTFRGREADVDLPAGMRCATSALAERRPFFIIHWLSEDEDTPAVGFASNGSGFPQVFRYEQPNAEGKVRLVQAACPNVRLRRDNGYFTPDCGPRPTHADFLDAVAQASRGRETRVECGLHTADNDAISCVLDALEKEVAFSAFFDLYWDSDEDSTVQAALAWQPRRVRPTLFQYFPAAATFNTPRYAPILLRRGCTEPRLRRVIPRRPTERRFVEIDCGPW